MMADVYECTMGVGCGECGICYAEAHGEPERYPLYTRPNPETRPHDGLAAELEALLAISRDEPLAEYTCISFDLLRRILAALSAGEGDVSASIYESAVKGRQDFRNAYREQLGVLKALADWKPDELAAIADLSQRQELSQMGVLRQALRLYQLHVLRLAAGETFNWSGDAQRAADFAGPLPLPPETN